MLAPNCQGFKLDANNKVVGVQLGITVVPGAQYEVYSVTLIDEVAAQNNTVANCTVLDRNGISTGRPVSLGWPGRGPAYPNSLLPGNPNNQHIITNGYIPPALGPLSLFIGPKEAPISDVVYGLGLPLNRHVCYTVIFREKGAVTVPPAGDTDLTAVLNRLQALEQWRSQLGQYLKGVPQ